MNDLFKKRERIERDCKIVRNILHQNFDKITAIILCGSYSRNEGVWIKKGGDLIPYNDYDFILVTEVNVDFEHLQDVRAELANRIGIKWVDIDVKNAYEIKRSKNIIKNIDIKNSGVVIDGDKNILSLFPYFNIKKVNKLDIETLFFTRIWTFFGSLDIYGFRDLDVEDAFYFRNQMMKAVYGIIDMLLIKNHQYQTSYGQKVKTVLTLPTINDELRQLIEWAYNERVDPTLKQISKEDVKNLYDKVFNTFFETSKDCLRYYRLFGFSNSILVYMNLYFTPHYLLRRLYFILRGVNRYEKVIASKYIQYCLMEAYSNPIKSQILLKKITKKINKITSIETEINNWDEARIIASEIRNTL